MHKDTVRSLGFPLHRRYRWMSVDMYARQTNQRGRDTALEVDIPTSETVVGDDGAEESCRGKLIKHFHVR